MAFKFGWIARQGRSKTLNKCFPHIILNTLIHMVVTIHVRIVLAHHFGRLMEMNQKSCEEEGTSSNSVMSSFKF